MDVQPDVVGRGEARVEHAESPVAIGLAERRQQRPTQRPHRALLEPARAHLRQHHHHLRTPGLSQACGKGVADHVGRDVLVLDVDRALRGRDGVEVERLHLTHRRTAVRGRIRARDGNVDVLQVRTQVAWPGVGATVRRPDPAPGGAPPALARQRAELRGCLTLDRDLHVVKRPVRAAVRSDAPRIVRRVRRGVPATGRQIEAAEERDGIVDHHDLLMMAGAERVVGVEMEPDTTVRPPPELDDGQQLAFEREQEREAPIEKVNAERAPARDHGVEKAPQILGQAVRHAVGAQPRAGLDVPSDHEHLLASVENRVDECPEVRIGVDQEGDPRCMSRGLTVAARGDDRGGTARVYGWPPRHGWCERVFCRKAPRDPSREHRQATPREGPGLARPSLLGAWICGSMDARVILAPPIERVR